MRLVKSKANRAQRAQTAGKLKAPNPTGKTAPKTKLDKKSFIRESALEIMERMNFNPIANLIKFAEGDVVGLGMMTQEEYDAPATNVIRGRRVVYQPSGREQALFLIDAGLRESATRELGRYGWSRKPNMHEVTSPDGSVSGSVVQFYLPENGREAGQA